MDHLYLRKLYALQEIPIALYDSHGELLVYFPDEEKAPFKLEKESPLLRQLMQQAEKIQIPFLYLDDNVFCFACLKVEDILFVIGPAARKTFAAEEAGSLRFRHHFSDDAKIRIISMNAATRYLSLIWYDMTQKDLDYRDIPLQIEQKETIFSGWNLEREMEEYQLNRSDLNQTHDAMEFEKRLLQCVRNGNVEEMEELMHHDIISQDDIGTVAKTPFKQTEYLMVSMITLLTRAAAEGGMRPEEAYQLGDMYLQRISTCTKQEQLNMITLRAQYEFTQKVAQARRVKSQYAFIEQCKDYVAKNLRRSFQVSDIAPAIGVSRTYLARKFSEVEGITIQQYIIQERCKHAASMLKHSDTPISVIASYFCFSSQSHFGKHFKDMYGITPKEYRERETSANVPSSRSY